MATVRNAVRSQRTRANDKRRPLVAEANAAKSLGAMNRLHALSTTLVQPGDFDSRLAQILATAAELLGTNQGNIRLIEPSTGSLRLAAAQGLSSEFIEYFAEGGCAACGKALELQRRVIVEDACNEALLEEGGDRQIILAAGVRGMICVPLISRAGQVLGVLNNYFPVPHRPSDFDFRVMELLARMAADYIEHQHAEQKLRESEERFQAFVRASCQFFFRMSPDWIQMRQFVGEDRGQADARESATWLQDHVHPADHVHVLKAIKGAIATERVLEMEYRQLDSDGTVRWVFSRAVPVRDAGGAIREWFGAASDITDEKAAAAALRSHQTDLDQRIQARTDDLDAANGRLRDEILERGRAHRQHRELLRRLALAQEGERRRISRVLHDEMGQDMSALLLGLNELARQFAIPPTTEKLRELCALAEAITKEIHEVAVELRPTSLDDLGLARATAAYVEAWSLRSNVKLEFHAHGLEERRLDPAIETTLYRIVQEALTNVIRHARAQAVSVILQVKGSEVCAIVEDDGVGFDLEASRKPGSLGLLGMRERAELIGGELTVESSEGKGAMVMVRVPLIDDGSISAL